MIRDKWTCQCPDHGKDGKKHNENENDDNGNNMLNECYDLHILSKAINIISTYYAVTWR